MTLTDHWTNDNDLTTIGHHHHHHHSLMNPSQRLPPPPPQSSSSSSSSTTSGIVTNGQSSPTNLLLSSSSSLLSSSSTVSSISPINQHRLTPTSNDCTLIMNNDHHHHHQTSTMSSASSTSSSFEPKRSYSSCALSLTDSDRSYSSTSTSTTDQQFNTGHFERKSYRPFRSNEEYLIAMKEDLAEWLNTLYGLDLTCENFINKLETGVILCQHANSVLRKAREYRQMNGATNAATNGYPSLQSLNSLSSNSSSSMMNGTNSNNNTNSDITNSNDRRDCYVVPVKMNALPGTFQARDNVANFIEWCRRIQIHECLLFETEDLVSRKNEKSFVLCLLEVARYGAKFGVLAPTLVQFEQEIDQEIEKDNQQQQQQQRFADHTQIPFMQPHQQQQQQNYITTDVTEMIDNNKNDDDMIPQTQIINNDLESLHEKVVNLLSRCTCPIQFYLEHLSEGKYRIGDTRTLIFVRILRNHVMVRVGGGWDTLEHYLEKHDPCRCRFGHRYANSTRASLPFANQMNQQNSIHMSPNRQIQQQQQQQYQHQQQQMHHQSQSMQVLLDRPEPHSANASPIAARKIFTPQHQQQNRLINHHHNDHNHSHSHLSHLQPQHHQLNSRRSSTSSNESHHTSSSSSSYSISDNNPNQNLNRQSPIDNVPHIKNNEHFVIPDRNNNIKGLVVNSGSNSINNNRLSSTTAAKTTPSSTAMRRHQTSKSVTPLSRIPTNINGNNMTNIRSFIPTKSASTITNKSLTPAHKQKSTSICSLVHSNNGGGGVGGGHSRIPTPSSSSSSSSQSSLSVDHRKLLTNYSSHNIYMACTSTPNNNSNNINKNNINHSNNGGLSVKSRSGTQAKIQSKYQHQQHQQLNGKNDTQKLNKSTTDISMASRSCTSSPSSLLLSNQLHNNGSKSISNKVPNDQTSATLSASRYRRNIASNRNGNQNHSNSYLMTGSLPRTKSTAAISTATTPISSSTLTNRLKKRQSNDSVISTMKNQQTPITSMTNGNGTVIDHNQRSDNHTPANSRKCLQTKQHNGSVTSLNSSSGCGDYSSHSSSTNELNRSSSNNSSSNGSLEDDEHHNSVVIENSVQIPPNKPITKYVDATSPLINKQLSSPAMMAGVTTASPSKSLVQVCSWIERNNQSLID